MQIVASASTICIAGFLERISAFLLQVHIAQRSSKQIESHLNKLWISCLCVWNFWEGFEEIWCLGHITCFLSEFNFSLHWSNCSLCSAWYINWPWSIYLLTSGSSYSRSYMTSPIKCLGVTFVNQLMHSVITTAVVKIFVTQKSKRHALKILQHVSDHIGSIIREW